MTSFEADRLHASDSLRRESAVRLAQVFDLHLRGASPALAAALEGSGDLAAVIVAAILEVADRSGRGWSTIAFDQLRQRHRGAPRSDAVIGHALIAALGDILGPEFDEATREAWSDGYIRAVEAVMASRRNRMDLVA